MPVMSSVELRELVLLCALLALTMLAVWMARRPAQGAVPPTVAPVTQPLEEQVRDVRHRVASVEMHTQRLPDHEMRLRRAEGEISEVRSGMGHLREGQARIEHQLNMLVQHQLHSDREDRP